MANIDEIMLASFQKEPAFNTIVIPKDIIVFHGGRSMESNVEFPVGIEYYKDTLKVVTTDGRKILKSDFISDEMKEDYLNSILDKNVRFAYFGDITTATAYSQDASILCVQSNCVGAYITKKEFKLLNLSDEENIFKLVYLSRNFLSEKDRRFLGAVYGMRDIATEKIPLYWKQTQDGFRLITYSRTTMRNNFRYYPYEPSEPEYFIIPKLLKIAKDQGCAGLVNMRFKGRPFELILGNPIKFLDRHLKSPLDWQHDSYLRGENLIVNSEELGKIFTTMKEYKTTNVDFHAGDLIQHSIWVSLYTQKYFLERPNKWIAELSFLPTDVLEDLTKIAIVGAFLHDIGKLGGAKIFYDKPNHPKEGYEYLNGTRLVLKLSDGTDLVPAKLFPEMFKFMNFKVIINEDILRLFVLGIVLLHWEFGDKIREINQNSSPATYATHVQTAAKSYNNMIKSWCFNTDNSELFS